MKTKLEEVVLLESIIKLINIDTIEIVPKLISKLKQLEKDIPYWSKELESINKQL